MPDAILEAVTPRFPQLPEGIPSTPETTEIWRTIAPWVSDIYEKDSQVWEEQMEQTQRSLRRLWFRSWMRRLWKEKPRDQKQIEDVYSARWANDQFKPFALPTQLRKGSLWSWHDLNFRMHATAGRRARILLLMRTIEALRPRSVLEIGFGEGLNLMMLAAQFPEIRFAGIELTEGGYRAAAALKGEPILPEKLQAFSPRPVLDVATHRAIELHHGSAANLPFAANEFDLVFTSLALEQMAAVQDEVLGEINRVTTRHAAMIEPFGDFNAEGLRRSYTRNLGYFCMPLSGLANYGLSVCSVNDGVPYKVHLRPALVVAEKSERAQ
jgi:ubiquinone/menaquinone biosynthesis C-methylase UbiE